MDMSGLERRGQAKNSSDALYGDVVVTFTSKTNIYLFVQTVNIDVNLVAKGDAALSKVDEKLVPMQNGCICCTLREDLLVEVARLAKEGRFHYLLIESTGISEPLPIAETFTFEIPLPGEGGKALSQIARLDTMVTVVDAYTFSKDIHSVEMLADRYKDQQIDPSDNRSVANLLVDQLEFANVILINKTDLVPEEKVSQIKALAAKLNPNAKVITSVRSKIAPKEILNTGMFNFDRAMLHPGWMQELRGQVRSGGFLSAFVSPHHKLPE
jgi:G3E family GTPase